MTKQRKCFLLAGVLLTLCMTAGCVQQAAQEEHAAVESTTPQGPNWFETRQVVSQEKNTYQILKFANEDVSYDLESGNKFYSSKNNIALTVEIYEGEDLALSDVLKTSMDYIKDNIKKQEVISEDDTKVHYHIEYDIMGELKSKEVICLKTKTGVLLHDLTYFEAVDTAEENVIQEVIKQFEGKI